MRNATKKKTSQKPKARPRVEDYPVVIIWDAEDKIFIADVPALQGCRTHGHTREEAIRNAADAAEGWLDVAQKYGDPIPPPPKDLSGKLVLRMPKDLHAQVAEIAARNGVSINTWIVTAVAREARL